MISILNFFNSVQFLFFTILSSILLKIILLIILIPQLWRSQNTKKTCFFLILVLFGSMMGEFTWALKISRWLFMPIIPYALVLFCVRISWALLIPQYQALGLFLDSLVEKKHSLSRFQKIKLCICNIISCYFVYLALFSQGINEQDRLITLDTDSAGSPLEIIIMRYTVYYILPILIIPHLVSCIKKIQTEQLPEILTHQLTKIIKYLMLPYLAAELLIALHFKFAIVKNYYNAIVGISALLITYISYLCIRNVMGLRFLNFTNHVESKHTFNFVDDFKFVLEQLSFASTHQELNHVTGTFFKQAFDIPIRKVALHLHNPITNELSRSNDINILVEEFCATNHPVVPAYIITNKILIYDEIVFSNFYEEDILRTIIIQFLEKINADIFIPIFEKERVIGFIIVEKNSRSNFLYSNIERDEMIVFASYLGNIINLLQNRNLDALIQQEKELQEELYIKNQEINQYKESIRSFLKNTKCKDIGILFYKHRRFIYANQTAKEIIKVNLNIQIGHPLTRAFKKIAQQVEEYKAPQTVLFKNSEGTQYIISGVSNLEQNNVILTISYPDVVDIIAKQLNFLKDPSKWDYILYLETTKPGQLINQLIPGNGEMLLNFKISLLQTALSKKATLLEMPEEDLMPLVEILHHVSMRETIETLQLKKIKCSKLELATQLFGINAIYGIAQTQKPLLEKLNANGTLFIQNIELLDLELQDYLAEFIKYGYFRLYKSEQKVTSSVRIICSTNCALSNLVQENNFSPLLFHELKKCTIYMPSLSGLPEGELHDLAQGYTQQTIKTHDFKNLLELTEKEQLNLTKNRPISFQELKTKVQQLLIQKSEKNNIVQDIQFDPAFEINDPELIQASRLGKHALRDHKIMLTLWNKFKNQNKIATFLGVNRSSVNRRFKEYNLEM